MERYCVEDKKGQTALKKEFLELAVEVARQIHDIEVDNWLNTKHDRGTKRATIYQIF